MDPKEGALDTDVWALTRTCGWQVRASRTHGWVCNRPALHDTEHQLLIRGGEVVARAAGYW